MLAEVIQYMCVNERDGGRKVKLQGVEVMKLDEFKCLGCCVQCTGTEVCKRLQEGWNGWHSANNRKVSARTQDKVHKKLVMPAMLYGLVAVLDGQD